MTRQLQIFFTLYLLSLGLFCHGQDPHYSQFFLSPSVVNPAITGSLKADWRVMSNHRQQWNNAETPFNTSSVTGEIKLLKQRTGDNALATSFSILADNSLDGAFKSVYASTTLAYHLKISEDSKIGAGFISQYVSRTLNLSSLTFGEQFTSGGFDASFPTGETALSNMKPFLSVGSGLLYSFSRDYLNFNIGSSIFNVNRPRQTFLSDPTEFLPIRFSSNFNLEYEASENVLLNFNSIFQSQKKQSYFAFGGSIGLDLTYSERSKIMYLGGWYRSNDAITPYWGLQIGNAQLGISYDITTSKQNSGPSVPRTLELSLIIRQKSQIPGVIPCPWN
jgi:type IX secretion system PorP/SprF family membrane protein